MNTHRATATKHDEETLYGASRANYPCQSDKEYHAKDVLDTRQVDTYECTHPRSTSCGCGRSAIRISWSRNGVAVIGQVVEQRWNPRPVLHLLLWEYPDRFPFIPYHTSWNSVEVKYRFLVANEHLKQCLIQCLIHVSIKKTRRDMSQTQHLQNTALRLGCRSSIRLILWRLSILRRILSFSQLAYKYSSYLDPIASKFPFSRRSLEASWWIVESPD